MNDSHLDPCGCCEGPAALTPASVANPPGLEALAYRVGTHARFNQAMHLALASRPALRALTTRDASDPSIALLDAWAAVLDVLTFYQERIANEGYLRTANERRSLLELSRALGYELRPGVAAGTFLAFTMDNVTGSPESAQLAVGTRAQSVPKQDETPQTFETIEEIEARPAWNALQPQQFASQLPLKLGDRTLHLKGTATNLKPGDALLIVGTERQNDPTNEHWDFRRVKSVETVSLPPTAGANAGYTVVTLDRGLGSFVPHVTPAQKKPVVYALRQRAAVFGYNAVDWKALPDITKAAYLGKKESELTAADKLEWPDFTPFVSAGTIDLDTVYPKIVAAGGWLVLSTPEYQEAYRITSATESARAQYALAGKTTRVSLAGENFEKFANALRTVVVYAESEALEWADQPVTTAVELGEIVLSSAVDGLAAGRWLSITGTDFTSGAAVGEIATIKSVDTVGGLTRIALTSNLVHRYVRSSVTINANVARATHGETIASEILGSGDGSQAFQRFTLKRVPLTYVSGAVASGAESSLVIRVKGVQWEEAPSFYAVPGNERVFVTRRADDGTVTVQFGDGLTGARLPTGTNNVIASYRAGLGLAGNVAAGQVTTLLTRPLGLKGVTNPVPASGGDDPESLDAARRNAPLTVLTLDRIVSVRDFEDFARAFAGIGKAQATLLWSGERQVVHLTVATADGGTVDPASELYRNLLDAIDGARHADQPVRVSAHVERRFGLAARVATDPALVRDDVLAQLATTLADAYSFARRDFAQGVTASELLALMQGVPGVVAIDLDALDGRNPLKHPNLPARAALWEGAAIKGAELLLIDPADITFTDLPL